MKPKASRFNTKEADYLAKAASRKHLVTYGEFAEVFGYANQGCGNVLSNMGMRLKEHSLPLLPVLVVSKGSDLPSADAGFYEALGLDNEAALRAEQHRCFEHDWSKEPFWSEDS